MHDREADDGLEPFELTYDQCSMGPGTGEADKEVVTALFGGKLGAGLARDGIAEGGLEGVRIGAIGEVKGGLLEEGISRGGGGAGLPLCEQTRRSSCLPTT